MKKAINDDLRFWCTVILVFAVTLGSCMSVWLWQGSYPIANHKDLADAGTYGDSYGYVNSLLSSLALAGAIAAIFLQTIELRYQRKELQESQESWKSQSKALLLSGMLQGIAATAASRDLSSHTELAKKFTDLIAIELNKLFPEGEVRFVGQFENFSKRAIRQLSKLDINNPDSQAEISDALKEGSQLIRQIAASQRMLVFAEQAVNLGVRYDQLRQLLDPANRPSNVVSSAFSTSTLPRLAEDTRALAIAIVDSMNN